MNEHEAIKLPPLISSPNFVAKESVLIKEESNSTNSPEKGQSEESDGSEKQSPSNQNFLSNLKGFNIEKATYKHYGNKSLMDSKTLEKIVNDSKSTRIEQGILEETEETKESETPKTSIKYIIDEQIGKILGASEQIISEEDLKPYNITTLNEILKLKCEQEKTKQDSIRCEFAVNILELMKMAEKLNIEANLIPFLFFGDIPAGTLKSKLKVLQENSETVINDLKESSKTNTVIPQITKILGDLKNRNTSNTNSSDRDSNSPRSPKLPNDSHRRVHSEGSIDKESVNLEPAKIPLPIPNYLPQLQQSQVQSNLHGPYYNQGSANMMQNPPTDRQTSVMGSPYSQKYSNVMYQQSQPYQGSNNYIPQQQFQFYVPSMSNNAPYMLQGHPPAPYSYNQYQGHEPEPKNSTGHSYRQEETSPAKKAKYSKPTSEINFMISTPKNPPARKYNTHNTSRDK